MLTLSLAKELRSRGAGEAANPGGYESPDGRREVGPRKALHQGFRLRHPVALQRRYEIEIFLTASHQLGDCQIVHFEAPAADRSGVGTRDGNKPGLPTGREHRRLGPNPVRIVAIRAFKRRGLANGTIDQVGSFRIVAWIHIGFPRDEELNWCIGELPQDGLTSHYDDVIVIRNCPRCPDHMFQLQTRHRSPNAPSG